MKTKAQVTFEFIFFFSMAIFVMLVFSTSILGTLSQDSREKTFSNIEDMGYFLQNEILLAAKVHDGYKRTVTLPDTLDGFEYTYEISDNEVIVEGVEEGEIIIYSIPQVTGTVNLLTFTIEKKEGVIYVTQ